MKRTFLALAGTALLGLSAANVALAADYPSRTIEMIVPFGPGGSTDTSARLFASVLGNYLPNSPDVVVVNKPGGATTIGMSAVQNADPDGYTIGLTSNSPVTIQPHFPTADYSYDSFEPVIKLVNIPQVLLVRKDAQWEDFDQWLAWVKDNPNEFVYSTPGNGSISDLSMAVLNESAGVQTRAIPYESGGKAMAAMLGGNVNAVATFQGNADESQTKVLVNFSSERSQKHPDVPTLRDAGVDAHKNAYIGIVAPKGTDAAIVQTLHDAFRKALEDPKVVEALGKQAFDISYGSSEDYARTIKDDFDQNGELLRRAGLIE
ncbi:Bug family tripartite tricarboxylate transporter substrate binding protein [Pseudooceanicola aestuarii]|uniref:Bug family tripartite tricarboxylate transporter substrate binding protein n=1 Tax=Pseudooceanicola aestuarii TaxID=2697319 RepID=UPI0013D1AC32|nr:tripartite tricarboxylate transporter substrate binding protein [Pseudooceanicola aestuarii]